MTARVTTLKGAGAGAYYVEALPGYYLDPDEPAGRWLGRGADELGLVGEVDPAAFLALMEGRDPRRAERWLGLRFGERSARGFDVTCSAPKSVSVLWALADPAIRVQVLAAHDAAVGALAGWIEDHAHTRFRIGGEVAVVDANGIVAAAFRQHTSRALDPQLHTHLVIANRVHSPDGRWLALDARLIKHDQRTLSALYHAGLRAELTTRLGVRWREPVNGISELADLPDPLLEAFSTRTTSMRARVEVKLDRFVETFGREPTPRERWRLEREAVTDSRPAKAHGVDAAGLHREWAAQARTLGHQPARTVTAATGHRVATGLDRDDARAISARALAAIEVRQSSWRPTELQREIANVTPTTTATTAAGMVAWIDATARSLTGRCVDLTPPISPDALCRKDGRPVAESVLDRALTTAAILTEEHDVLAWAARRMTAAVPHPDLTAGRLAGLDRAQVDAAAQVAGCRDLVLVVGPAGTGKTTALAPAVHALCADHRPVVGLAPTATAAQVLADETGMAADTIDRFLLDHRSARARWPVGTTVIVDEAGMVATSKLAELARRADVHGWRVVLVGDPMQFSAVDRGGMFGLLVNAYGAVELDQVRRFTHAWERDASLQLRAGNVDVADVYEHHGRLHGGTSHQMETEITRRWFDHRYFGESVLLMAVSRDEVERLNHRCQQLRHQAGELHSGGPTVTAGVYRLHAGDEVMTRHNDRRLVTDTGEHVRNRATWTVTAVHPDQTLTVSGHDGTITLPAGYVAEYVELAYARTAIGAQGRTVDIGLLYLDHTTDIRNLYVPMTRGRSRNDVYAVTDGEQTARDVVASSIAIDWIDQPAHQRRQQLHDALHGHHPGLLDPIDRHRIADERDRLTRHLRDAEYTIATGPAERARIERDITSARENLDHITGELNGIADTIRRYNKPALRHLHPDALSAARNEQPRLEGRQQAAGGYLQRLEQQLREHHERVADSHTTIARRHRIEARRDRYTEILHANDTIRADLTTPSPEPGITYDHTPSRSDGHGIEI